MIPRRQFLLAGPIWAGMGLSGAAPVEEPHFPSRLHLYVWRNWELANTAEIARVVGATEADVLRLGESMGLPEKRALNPDQLRRLYVTVIRQNWHVLPESQIIRLLGWDRERFEFTLKEDDFLDVKLGPKPECPELRYAPPSAREREAAARLKGIVREAFGAAMGLRGEECFDFIRELSGRSFAPLREPGLAPTAGEIDLTRGWEVAQPEGAILREAAARFREYLTSAMGARLGGGRAIRLAVDPARVDAAESFEIETGEGEVRITGGDESGVLQGIYFLQDAMERRGAPFLAPGKAARRCAWNPRYLYSYFALYGDPLVETDIDPLPDGYLEKLARVGINGVWMQAVLNTLAPSRTFPEFGANCELRLKNLDRLAERARRFGMKLYLYLNEPRAMREEFFARHPEMRGSSSKGLHAICTSVPEVREWIADTLAHVFRAAPGLGGVFSISSSENFTNCFSHGGSWGVAAPVAKGCPRCSQRKSWEVFAELLTTFRDGVRRSSKSAEVIAWDWGWTEELSANLIPLLPRDVRTMSISEWFQPVERGGVRTRVGEYSISVVGPGPRATTNWKLARSRGIRPMAKLQFNNTWEISATPYIPVPHLIVEHCRRLAGAGVTGIMPSWTCGGYPSPNLAAAKAWYFEPRRTNDEILADVARQRYGESAAPLLVEAWRKFSEAFTEFPYGVAVYTIPTQHGPANLLRLRRSGRRASMILYPSDDLKAWCGAYPPEVVLSQFRRMAKGWEEGLKALEAAGAKAGKTRGRLAACDREIAATCLHHFQSVANQVEFYLLRARMDAADGAERKATLARMAAIARDEETIARRQFHPARQNSLIAYEASNHYYYRPLDLVEKVFNCRQVLAEIEREQG